MGTELQYSLNLLATSPKPNGDALDGLRSADLWHCSRTGFFKMSIASGLDKLQESMDRLLEQYNRESVRKTMLKQEEIFKEQVKELHRLYKVQKILMAELRIKEYKLRPRAGFDYMDTDWKSGFWSPCGPQPSHPYFSNNYYRITQSTFDNNFHQQYEIRPDQSSQEASSWPVETSEIHRGFDLGRPRGVDTSSEVGATHDQASHFRWSTKDKMAISSSNDLHYDPDEESDVELTLSIGRSTGKKKSKHRLGCSESNPDETRQPSSSASARSDREEERGDKKKLALALLALSDAKLEQDMNFVSY